MSMIQIQIKIRRKRERWEGRERIRTIVLLAQIVSNIRKEGTAKPKVLVLTVQR
jgi:hypothetical protein